ncbi:MAG: aldo/keto reductase [Gammaproteobacteria bacterium]|nr:aldo/keto reductase [Gammaproteobacteria bacterium]
MTRSNLPLTRRNFLKLLAALSASISFPIRMSSAQESQRLRAIPASGELIPIVGLGTWRTFNLNNRESSKAVLKRFTELNGKLIDTSPMYGDAERAIGILGGELDVLDDLFVATKVWTRGKQAGLDQLQKSRDYIGKTPLDLAQVHNLVDWRTQLATLRELKDAGLVRYIGITHYVVSAHAELERIIRNEQIDFVQVNYNIAVRDADARLLPAAADRGVAVIINRPYAEGALFRNVRDKALPDWAQEFDCDTFGKFFLKFILSHPAVTCAIPATSKVHHLEDNMGAAAGRLPDNAQRKKMVQWFNDL